MNSTKEDPRKILAASKTILLVDWPNPGVPRALINAGFTVYCHSPNGYTSATLVDKLPTNTEAKSIFPPKNDYEKGYLVFSKIDSGPISVDIVNVYRPESELPQIIQNLVLPLKAKILWMQTTGTSALAQELCNQNRIILLEELDIAEIANDCRG